MIETRLLCAVKYIQDLADQTLLAATGYCGKVYQACRDLPDISGAAIMTMNHHHQVHLIMKAGRHAGFCIDLFGLHVHKKLSMAASQRRLTAGSQDKDKQVQRLSTLFQPHACR